MRRGTTPTIQIECDIDLTGYTVFATIAQGSSELTLTPAIEATESGSTLSITLTQEQTLALAEKVKAQMQVRAINAVGTAIASNIMPLDVERILLDGVIESDNPITPIITPISDGGGGLLV